MTKERKNPFEPPSIEVKRESYLLAEGIEDLIWCKAGRNAAAVLIALLSCFHNMATTMIEEVNADGCEDVGQMFADMLELFENGACSLADDPAQGRFVFPQRSTVH
jgi:hypothetical protein